LDGQVKARASAPGRLLVVFGCGGDRDVGKRPLMGQMAEEAADVVVVTSDNPRGEPPEGVIADILAGMERPDPLVEPDRRRAIAVALAAASAADLIVVAGRGHETIQEMAGLQLPFDDRAVVVEEWSRIMDSGSGPGAER
ncbi:MAG TPA: cyanophycin synthetase, partial [Acidimicrobiales bacterium]|nr:cyanophycin synthetase [Acidimicrobiales bacterium]